MGPHSRLEEQYQQLLVEKDTDIKQLRARICRLEQAERRLKKKAAERNDYLANKEAELAELRRVAQTAEERNNKQEGVIRGLTGEVEHWRGWWINEYYCLKVALSLTRDPNDQGVKAMKESSQARFVSWSAGLSQ